MESQDLLIQGWTVCFLINSIITVYIHTPYPVFWDFPGGASGKELTFQCRRPERRRFDPRVGQIPWRRAWQPTLVFLPGESHGQRSWWATAAAKSLQSCPTLCDPIDGSPPGSAVPGILQARTLERVAISFSSAWKWKVKVKSLSRAQLLATPWTAAHQAPPSMGFSRREYRSGVPLPSLGLQYTWSQKVGHDWSNLAYSRHAQPMFYLFCIGWIQQKFHWLLLAYY